MASRDAAPVTTKTLDRVAPRLLAEARWRDRASATPGRAHETQVRRDLYYYALGRADRLPPEWQGARERAALEASSEYALYRALHARYGALSGQPLFPAPRAPACQKEYKALERLGLTQDGAYAWLRSDADSNSGQAKRARAAARKRRREAVGQPPAASDRAADSSDDEPSDGEPWPRRTRRLVRTQSVRLADALHQHAASLPGPRAQKRARIVTLADLPGSPADTSATAPPLLQTTSSSGRTTSTLQLRHAAPPSPPENTE